MMNIKRIRFDEFGPYRDWSFTTGDNGVQLMYGPNESGKTSLLEGMRTLLFGGTHKAYGPMTGALDVDRNGESYYIGRKGKQLDFYSPGHPAIHEEPAQHWWYGIDKKTYNRIFALTLDDLQGLDVLQEVEVRSRFFGAEGGEHLGGAVKDVEKGATDLLVASSNGKRRINVLMDELKENRQKLSQLAEHEAQYVELQTVFHSTEQTEMELQNQLKEWKEYRDGIDVVLRAWDTYRRSEEARMHMQQYNSELALSRDEFLRLDEEIKRARDNMQLWQEKEAALMPANFSPDSPFGTYGQDIEDLIQQGAKWEQLRRECEEGDAYIRKVREQLEFSRTLHSAWRHDEPMAEDINWFDGERLASRLRTAKEQLLHWQDRKPAEATDEVPTANLEGASLPNFSEEELAKKEYLERELDRILMDIDQVEARRNSYGSDAQPTILPKWLQRISGIGAVIAVLVVLAGLLVLESALYTIGGFIFLILSMGIFWYATWRLHNGNSDVSKLNYELQILSSRKSDVEHQLEALIKAATPTVSPVPSLEGEAHLERWIQEGHTLQSIYDEALAAWQNWLPRGAAKSLDEDDFFGLKHEYDQYHEQLRTIEGYEKRLAEHKEGLRIIEDQAMALWYNLGIESPVSPTELKRIYNQYKNFQQNKIVWEQKEAQRKSFRNEYDNWHRKEKELLLRQKELLHKAGMESSNEYRQHLIDEDQYKQWQTIYKQSQVQLDLLAPDAENKDLFYRRLREGNKDNWLDELAHSEREIASIEDKLATLYERRGQIVEAMRTLGSDQEQHQMLQEREALQSELESALEDWATQVLISHCMDKAQQSYEQEKQPHMLELASSYVEKLTGERYTLDILGINKGVALINNNGERLELKFWSSGLADQVYLALRLALAKVFSYQVESLPIILDDILVRFDENRQRSALELLAELGKNQQIWLFTCQCSVYDMAQSIMGIDCHRLSRS